MNVEIVVPINFSSYKTLYILTKLLLFPDLIFISTKIIIVDWVLLT